MYEVGVRGTFQAAHRLRGPFGPATRLHGHTYRVEVTVRGPELNADGALMDVGLLRGLLEEIMTRFDFQDLDAISVFGGRNTTAEVVAGQIFESLRGGLTGVSQAKMLRVRVYESPDVYAGLEGPVRDSSADR